MYIQGIRAIDAIRTSTNVYRRRVRMGASARTWRTIMNVLVWRVSKVSAAIIFNLFTIDWYLLGFNGFSLCQARTVRSILMNVKRIHAPLALRVWMASPATRASARMD